MTKYWEAVQDEIRELSFTQKKPLEEVKELMEKKHGFYASTRAYRMKLKEWGLMRHRPRKSRKFVRQSEDTEQTRPLHSEDEGVARSRSSSRTAEPLSTEPIQNSGNSIHSELQNERDGDQVVSVTRSPAEPTFMSLLGSDQNLQPCVDPWAQARTRASEAVLDMLGAILDNDSQKLEAMIFSNTNHINDPVGLPFDTPNSRFYGHSFSNQVVIMQHPGQTLLDIASAMPCGPVIWVMTSHGAIGSRHPLGQDLALHNAIKNNRPYNVQTLLLCGRSDVNGLPGTSWKPLFQAIFWNSLEIVNILLKRGADANLVSSSPYHPGNFTALQLCLQHRNQSHTDPLVPQIREKCTRTLKTLLEAGADIHLLPDPASISPFKSFMSPWENKLHWTRELSDDEMDCLRLFLSRGANLKESFSNFLCTSSRCNTFEHQLLWHSTPQMARFVIDHFEKHQNYDGSGLLHELLGFCPDAKRHPADTLRDIEVLTRKGISPNSADSEGLTPLMHCLEQCPAVDLVSRLQMLLKCGADVEIQSTGGDLPYVHAARILKEPLLSDVMKALVSKIRGRYVRFVGDVSHTWGGKFFPISPSQTYEQVMCSMRQTEEFERYMREMVPDDVQPAFQRAYFDILSSNCLDTMAEVAKSKFLDMREKQEVVCILSMRKGIDLPDHQFDPGLIMALLDPQPITSPSLQNVEKEAGIEAQDTASSSVMERASQPSPEMDPAGISHASASPSPSSPPYQPWRFNPNNSSSSFSSQTANLSSSRTKSKSKSPPPSPPAHTPPPPPPPLALEDHESK